MPDNQHPRPTGKSGVEYPVSPERFADTGSPADEHQNPAYRILSADSPEDAARSCLEAVVRIENVLSGAVFVRDANRRQWMRIGYQAKGADFIRSEACFAEKDFPLAFDARNPITADAHDFILPTGSTNQVDESASASILALPAGCKGAVAGAIVIRHPKDSPLGKTKLWELVSLSSIFGGSIDRLNTESAFRVHKSNEKMYRTIVEMTPHIIGISTIEDGQFIDANEAFTKMLGYTKQEVLGKTSKELDIFVDPDSRNEGMKLFHRDGELEHYEIKYRAKDGSVLDVIVSAKPIEYQGRPCLLTIHTVVTQLKQAQKELEKSKRELETRVRNRTHELEQANQALSEAEERLRAAYDGMPAPLYILKRVDDDFVLVDFNRAADQESDWQLKELRGVRARDFYSSLGRSDIFESMDQAFRHKDTIIRDITYRYHTTGRERSIIASFAYVPPDFVLMSSIDITDRKRAEEQLVAHQDQLRRLAAELTAAESRERRRIAGDLHDQIGQILFLAKVKLRSLLKIQHPDVAEAARDIGELIGWALRDVRTLIVDISPPILYELGLVEALRDFAEKLQAEHDIRTVVIDDGRPIQLSPDLLDLVFRAVRELSINVLKHAGASNLTISLYEENDRLTVEVKDDGIGFSPTTAFSPRDEESGFGLFSLKERLTSIGGRLKVDSRSDRGATVTVEFPYR